MRKRMISILLTLCMVLSIAPAAVFAEDSTAPADITGEGTTEGEVDITGAGTETEPYLIYTAAGLKTFRDKVNGQNGQTKQSDAHAKLMKDIVLNDGTFDEDGNWSEGGTLMEWTPIGWFKTDSDNAAYSGTFDGDGHTIKGLYVTGQREHAGLFGYTKGAAIQDVTVDGYVSISGNFTGENDSASVGGIVGCAINTTITGCTNLCTVKSACSSVKAGSFAGGIAGNVNMTNSGVDHSVTKCRNSGKVILTAGYDGLHVGGIAGSSGVVVSNCYNTGEIKVTSDHVDHRRLCVGGVVGQNGVGGQVSSCYNTGAVTVTGDVSTASSVGFGCVVGVSGSEVTNCCFLTGTTGTTDKVTAGVGNTVTGGATGRVDGKTKEEFADGTVLGLLKQNDTTNAWGACGYLEAAGMIVPLLSWQTSDTFPIYTKEDLEQFRDMVNGGNSGLCAKLMNDIDLAGSETDPWTPIVGNYGYGGTFDGDGHTIRGLYVKGGEYAGLFGSVWCGTVKNVTVTGYVEGTQFVGGIVGYGNGASITGCTNAAVVKAKCDGGFVGVGGIVGYFIAKGNVGNCANLGSVWAQIDSNQGMAKVGGIAGGLGDLNVTIADCYNAGSIAIEDSGTGEYDVVSYLGGIVGSTLMTLEPGYISNCYSVGPLTYSGSASAVICGIAGYVDSYGIINCYWLEGTAESGVGGDPRQVTNTSAHTKSEFANGTVLNLLKGDSDDSPWADECEYVDAAGMILPIFKRQSGSHKHDFEWKHTDTEHWQECVCGATRNRGEHSGGSVCSVCGKVLRSSSTGGSSSRPGYTVTVEKSANGSVSADRKTASRGTTVTITVTPDKGYTLETITVLDKNGNELKLTDKGDGKYSFIMPSGKVTVTATFMDDNTMLNFFVDVKASDYYYDAVLWAAQNGITSGTDAVHFSPSLPCTRAQIVTFLWRAAGCPVVNYAMNMTDVSEDAYYAEAVRWALSLGITDGTTATTFSPDETCTRAQAVAFLFRYAAPAAVTLQELVSGFSDAASVPGYALASMNWALAEDIVQGSGTKLMPNDPCTRAQIVTLLYRTLEK